MHLPKIHLSPGELLADSERRPQSDKPEAHGGFALTHWAGTGEDEDKLAKELKVTLRCIPLDSDDDEAGTCPFTGKPSAKRVVFAKAY